MDSISRINALLDKNSFSAFMINTRDEFLDEFVPPHLARMEWLTGFTGSNGIAVISKDIKCFFTDGRYLIQAKKELPDEFTIMDISKISIPKWIAKNFAAGDKIAYDPRCFTANFIRKIKKVIRSFEIKLYRTIENPVDGIWQRDFPAAQPIKLLSDEQAGISTKNKLRELKFFDDMTGKQGYLTCDTASICWLLNIRAHDSEYTPILHSYLLYNKRQSFLYCDPSKVTAEAKEYFASLKVTILDLSELVQFATNCKEHKIKQVFLDTLFVNYFFFSELKNKHIDIIKVADPVIAAKAVKNSVEINGSKHAHLLDGAAKTKFLFWLEQNKANDNLDELAIVEKLHAFRKSHKEFLYPSFNTISAFAENGAVIHYKPTANSNKKFDKNSLLLVDSGGQYADGTTDITRTILIGDQAQPEQKRNFTLVLKGHISLATAIFPKGTTGCQLDILARQFLWQDLKDYEHGTGHGIGCFLNVHEGPQNLSKAAVNVSLQPGMILSNEPGIYIEDKYGIRLENVLLVKEESENFLRFETISLAPIDENLVDFTLLEDKEKAWLRNYHQKILDNLANLSSEERHWVESKVNYY